MSATESVTATALDRAMLTGDWRNTNTNGGISRIVCEESGAGLTVRAYGRALPHDRDWGPVEAPVFAFEFDSTQAGAFLAIFDLGFEEVRMQANVKGGVLVVVTLNRFRDDSGRANYFNREFFYRTKQ